MSELDDFSGSTVYPIAYKEGYQRCHRELYPEITRLQAENERLRALTESLTRTPNFKGHRIMNDM